MGSMMDVLHWNLICDTCGNYRRERATTIEEKQQLEGDCCEQPWCTGHYKLINLEDYGDVSDLANTRTTRQKAIKEVFFDLPTFDRDAYREECKLEAERNAKIDRIMAPTQKVCPNCGNPSIRKISTAGRVVSVAALGLASSKIGKQYQCNYCKHTW